MVVCGVQSVDEEAHHDEGSHITSVHTLSPHVYSFGCICNFLGTFSHTHRRVAAVSVAKRVADEMGVKLGTTVGDRMVFFVHVFLLFSMFLVHILLMCLCGVFVQCAFQCI